jgi:CRP/FNR family transcriptional regulator, cyclic AMP receptor protein
MNDVYLQKISEHPFLKGLSPQHLKRVSEFAMSVQFQPGQIIFKTGDPANRFYLIQSGKVVLRDPGSAQDIQVIGPGDVLGWSWLFEPYEWQFDAVALEPTWSVFLYGTRLREVCDSDPDLGYELLKRCTCVAIERLHSTAQKLLQQMPRKAI